MKSLSGRKNLLEQSAFGFTNSLMYSLEESRKLRILITWVLILPSNLIALWRCSYLVSKTIFILSSYVEVYVIKKIQVWTLCLWLVSRPPKSGCFFENFLWSYFGNHFQAKIVLQSTLLFDSLTVFHMVWKNQESLEIWLDGFSTFKNAKNVLLTHFLGLVLPEI